MLGVKKYGTGGRYLPDARTGGTGGRRRLYGSLSSLPSSVSSRPVRERRGRQDDRKRVKDIKVKQFKESGMDWSLVLHTEFI